MKRLILLLGDFVKSFGNVTIKPHCARNTLTQSCWTAEHWAHSRRWNAWNSLSHADARAHRYWGENKGKHGTRLRRETCSYGDEQWGLTSTQCTKQVFGGENKRLFRRRLIWFNFHMAVLCQVISIFSLATVMWLKYLAQCWLQKSGAGPTLLNGRDVILKPPSHFAMVEMGHNSFSSKEQSFSWWEERYLKYWR